MKFKNIKYAGIILAFAMFAASCVKQDFTEPQPQTNDTSVYKPVISIADLINLSPSGTLLKLDTSAYIKATVIANDETGNYYKALVIQDSTAGIEIDIRATGTYLRYPIGQMVFVKLKGLYLGTYGGAYKLGAEYNGGVGQIPEALYKNFIFTSPGGKPIKPKVKHFTDVFTKYNYNTLIKFENVQFKNSELGRTYADAKNKVTSDVMVRDCNKVGAIVRTSGYASFAAEPIPTGNGDITVVYTVYNGTPQLYVRNTTDVHLTKPRCGFWFDEEFDGNLGTFSQYSKTGDEFWLYSSQYDCAIMSGYTGANHTNEDWLISPSLDLTNFSVAILNFRHACSLYGSSWNNLSVKVSTDYVSGDPNNATWTDLTGYTKPTNFTFVSSGDIDISAFKSNPNVHIAFKYTSNTSSGAKWEISSVSVDAH